MIITRELRLAASLILVGSAISISGQTTVTNNNDGAASIVPMYTGSSTLGNSGITQSSGRVGIGTSNPAAALDISTAGVSSANLQFDWTYQPTVYLHSILNTFDSGNGTMRFALKDNGSAVTPLTLTSGGLVGVGTTAPSYTLDVAGFIHSSTGGVVFPDGSIQTTACAPGCTTISEPDPLDSVFSVVGGNVGLGTQNPAAEFDVEGTSPTINVGAGGAYLYNGNTMYSVNTALFNFYLANGLATVPTGATGAYNFSAGYYSMQSLTSGYENSAFGNYSLTYNTTGFHNTGLGFEALEYNTTGNSNTAVGEGAMWQHVTGDSNTALGLDTMVHDIGSSQATAIGQDALYSTTSSTYDTSVGHQSMYNNTVGGENTALGERALYLNTTGNYNTAVGHMAGNASITGNGNTTGSYNTYLGVFSGPGSSTTQYTYQTDIGAFSVGSCNDCVVLGRSIDAVTVPGKLGIGTAAPAYSLDVAGTIRTSGGIVFPDGSIQKSALNLQDSGANVILGTGGRLGIGTSNPAVALSVYPAEGGEPSGIFYTDSAGRGLRVATSDYVFGTTTGTFLNLGMLAGTGVTSATIQAQSGSASENLILEPNGGRIGIGTSTPGATLEVKGNVKLTAGSGASITFQDGTVQSTAYTGTVSGGDYAEAVDVTGERASFEPGELLTIDPENPGKFLKSNSAYSTMVAGVYSTKPGTVGRRESKPQTADEIPMALVGIVPLKVSAENGPIQAGDLLVSSSTPGYAMKGTDRDRMLGAVIGKALGRLDSGTGVIEVLISLR